MGSGKPFCDRWITDMRLSWKVWTTDFLTVGFMKGEDWITPGGSQRKTGKASIMLRHIMHHTDRPFSEDGSCMCGREEWKKWEMNCYWNNEVKWKRKSKKRWFQHNFRFRCSGLHATSHFHSILLDIICFYFNSCMFCQSPFAQYVS